MEGVNLPAMVEEMRWRQWSIVVLLTLLWHLLVFFAPWQKIFPPSEIQLPRVEIQQVDPKKLAQVRKQWREQNKKLLLSKSPAAPDIPEPKDARYLSDRNRKVEREQRAAQTNVIPRPGSGAADQTQTQAQPKPQKRGLPKLADLGVPLRLGETAPVRTPLPNPEHLRQPSQAGGDQAIDDQQLPVGSENLLNTQQSIYYSFYSRLYEAIGPVWQSRIREVPYTRRVPQGEYVTQVEVIMDRSGNLVDIRYLKSSGIAEFDAAVETSWRRIGKFPNPPSGLLESDGTVHTGWTFSVEVGSDFNLNYAPPRRNY